MNDEHLHVEVEDVLEVDELDSFANLTHKDGTRSFRQHEIVVNDPLKQFASFDEFEQEANLFFAIVVGVVELNEPRIAKRFHNLYFALHIESIGFFGRLNEFGRKTQSSRFLAALVNRSEFAPSDLLLQNVIIAHVDATPDEHVARFERRFYLCITSTLKK